MGLQATIIPNPEYVSITFFSNENPYTINKKSGRIDINFHRIVALSELVESVIQKEIPIDQALMDLASIHGKPMLYSKLVNIFSISLSSISAACVFGGGYNEMFVSGVIRFIRWYNQCMGSSFFQNLIIALRCFCHCVLTVFSFFFGSLFH
jgi:uncharacterized membrane protein YjjP (DUF1212 family)